MKTISQNVMIKKAKNYLNLSVSFAAILTSSSVFAEGTVLEIEGATIRGNQELPTVLYVVPWKPAKVYSLEKAEHALIDIKKIEPIERASFKRLISYHGQFLQTQKNDSLTTNPTIHAEN